MRKSLTKRKKTKKIKYFKFSLKLSQKQKEIIEVYCKRRNTTSNKLIKTAIKEYLIRYEKEFPIFTGIGDNQLVLFTFDEENDTVSIASE